MKNLKKFDIILVTILASFFSLALTWRYDDPFVLRNFMVNFLFTFFVSEFLFLCLWPNLLKIRIQKEIPKIEKKEYFIYGFIVLLMLVVSMIIFYPSIGNFDGECLWDSINKNEWSNWNPIPYTLIFIGIPSLISNNIFSTTIFQTIFVWFMTLYLFIYIRKNYLDFKTTLIFLILFVLNPIYIKYSVFVSKDTIYSWCMLFLTINLINVVNSDSKWLEKTKNKFLFLLSSITVLFFRHNGIIPFVATFIYMLIMLPKIRKFVFVSLISILSMFFIVTGPIYNFFKIGGTLGYTETMGVLMQNISYYHMHSKNMTNEEKEVLYNIIPQDVWVTKYDSRDFNPIKIFCGEDNYQTCDFDREKYEKNSGKLINTWLELTPRNFDLFIRSYLNITTPIWEIRDRMGEIDFLYWSSPELVKPDLNQVFYDSYISYYEFISTSPFRLLFVNLGEGLFMIFLSLAIIIRKTRFDLKSLVAFVPVIVNAAVIMLLITGNEYRFVYAQGLCFLPLILHGLLDFKTRKEKIV